jgi:NADH:ubiquinone oxidoreductase subunit 6 (subunit J)
MKKIIIFLGAVLISFSANAEITLNDKVEITKVVFDLSETINAADWNYLTVLISPNASKEFQDGMISLVGKNIKFEQNITDFEELGDGKIKAKGRFAAEQVGTSISGLSDYFILEKVGGEWKIVDADFYKKLSTEYVFKFVIVIMIAVFVMVIPMLAFWVWMLVDAIQRPIENKIPWIVILALLQFLAAIIYFFVVYRKRKTPKQEFACEGIKKQV